MRRCFFKRAVRAALPALLIVSTSPLPARDALAQVAQVPVAVDGDVEQDISEAEKRVARVDYEGTIAILERTSKRSGLTHEQMTRVVRNLAIAHAVVGHGEVARDLFVKLLALDPEFKIDPNLTPRVQAPYFEARGFWTAQSSKPGIEVGVTPRRESDSRIRITLRDPLHFVARVVMGYRWDGPEPFVIKALPPMSQTADIPPAQGGSGHLEFFARAVDSKDCVLFESGSPDAPLSAVAPAPAPVMERPSSGGNGEHRSSMFSSPIFWIVAGAVVVGGAVGTYLAVRPTTSTTEQLTPTLACGSRACL